MTIFSKLYGWLAAAGAVLVAFAGAVLYGRSKGKAGQKASDDAREAQANAKAVQQTIKTQESRNETDLAVQSLPDAPVQKVADAAPDTAAGRLRDDWSRD